MQASRKAVVAEESVNRVHIDLLSMQVVIHVQVVRQRLMVSSQVPRPLSLWSDSVSPSVRGGRMSSAWGYWLEGGTAKQPVRTKQAVVRTSRTTSDPQVIHIRGSKIAHSVVQMLTDVGRLVSEARRISAMG